MTILDGKNIVQLREGGEPGKTVRRIPVVEYMYVALIILAVCVASCGGDDETGSGEPTAMSGDTASTDSTDSTDPNDSDATGGDGSVGDGDGSATPADRVPGTSWPYCSRDGRGVLPESVGRWCGDPVECYWEWAYCADLDADYDWVGDERTVCALACWCRGLDPFDEFSSGTVECAPYTDSRAGWTSAGVADQ